MLYKTNCRRSKLEVNVPLTFPCMQYHSLFPCQHLPREDWLRMFTVQRRPAGPSAHYHHQLPSPTVKTLLFPRQSMVSSRSRRELPCSQCAQRDHCIVINGPRNGIDSVPLPAGQISCADTFSLADHAVKKRNCVKRSAGVCSDRCRSKTIEAQCLRHHCHDSNQ